MPTTSVSKFSAEAGLLTYTIPVSFFGNEDSHFFTKSIAIGGRKARYVWLTAAELVPKIAYFLRNKFIYSDIKIYLKGLMDAKKHQNLFTHKFTIRRYMQLNISKIYIYKKLMQYL